MAAPRPGARPEDEHPQIESTGTGRVVDPAYARRRKSIIRRFAILIIGTVVILVGIAIAPIPGPGPMVLGPLGLAILATEFEWARRLLNRFRTGAMDIQAQTDRLTGMVSRVWIIPVVAVYWFLVWQATRYLDVRDGIVWAVGISTFIPVAYWCYRVAVLRARKQPLRKLYRKIKHGVEARRAAHRGPTPPSG